MVERGLLWIACAHCRSCCLEPNTVGQDAGSALFFSDAAVHSEPTPLQRTPNMATPKAGYTVAPQTGAQFSPFADVRGTGARHECAIDSGASPSQPHPCAQLCAVVML